jgi:lipopolysaccharide assembly outer membrane protein LptD (OstA)
MGRLKFIAMGLFVLLILVTFPVAAATTLDNDVTIDADEMEYDIDAKAVTASGNVILRSPDLEIRADKMVYYDTGWVEVEGKAHIKTDKGESEGDGLRYHVPTKTGEIKHLLGQEERIYFKGESGSVSPEEETVKKGTATRCELPKPCYRLHAARIRLRNGRLIIERGYLDIKGIPVFPIFYLNVSSNKVGDWPDIKIGQDEERGFFGTYKRDFNIASNLTGNGNVTLGTNQYVQLGGGLTWSPGAGFSLSTTSAIEWSENDDKTLSLSASKTVWSKNNQSISVGLFENHNETNRSKSDPRYRYDPTYDGDLYGMRVYYSPKSDMTMSLGWADANGEYYGDAGWGLDSTFYWKESIGKDWRFIANAGYHWGNGEGRWNTRNISITHYFHCIYATVTRDFQNVENPSWQIGFGIRF